MIEDKLIVSPLAEIDIVVAKDWYELQKDELGVDFLFEIDNIFSRIKRNPKQFHKTQKHIRKANIKRFPFSIYFTTIEENIIVFAVFHNSQNPVIWKNRIKHMPKKRKL